MTRPATAPSTWSTSLFSLSWSTAPSLLRQAARRVNKSDEGVRFKVVRFGMPRPVLPICQIFKSLNRPPFLSFQATIDGKRAERNEGRSEHQGCPQDGPTRADRRVQKGRAKQDEQRAVNPPSDLHGRRDTRKVLERHADAQEEQEGTSLEESNGA